MSIDRCSESPAAFATRFQRFRRGGLNRHFKQNRNIDSERLGKASKKINRGIELASFNAADRRSVNASVDSKVLLRNAFGSPDLPEIPTDAFTMFHPGMATILPSINPSNIYHIFRVKDLRLPSWHPFGGIMKIAVGIIGLFLGLLVLLQSCAVTAGSGLLNDQATGSAGAVGMLTGVLLVIGGAFSFGLPLVGAIIFFVSALMAFIASSQGSFGDMSVWGVIALLLGVMGFFTWRSAKRKKSQPAA